MKLTKIGMGMTLTGAMVLAFAQGNGALAGIKAKADAAVAAQENAVKGQDGWLFFTPELRYLSAGPFWGENAAKASHVGNPDAADPLPAILDFKRQLDGAGIDLLIVPVPGKAAIYPDKLIPGAKATATSRIDADQAKFLKVLGDNGVKTLDLTPVFLQYRATHPAAALYCKTDSHWSGEGISVASAAIAAAVKKQPWYAAIPKTTYPASKVQVTAKGDLADLVKPAVGAETFKLTGYKSATANPNSPLLLLGDSHNLIFSAGAESGMLAKGAGFPENLAAQLRFTPTVEAVMGSGATPARGNLARKPSWRKGKKMVVWLFTSREFTEGQGWKNVPVIR